jgi:hypothetical protein
MGIVGAYGGLTKANVFNHGNGVSAVKLDP